MKLRKNFLRRLSHSRKITKDPIKQIANCIDALSMRQQKSYFIISLCCASKTRFEGKKMLKLAYMHKHMKIVVEDWEGEQMRKMVRGNHIKLLRLSAINSTGNVASVVDSSVPCIPLKIVLYPDNICKEREKTYKNILF